MAPLLEVDKLSVAHYGDRGLRHVLQGIDLQIADGETLGLVGESGSGKSVLLSAITGLLNPPWRIADGRVRFDGRDLVKLPEPELRRIRGRELGLALSNPRQHLNPILPLGRQIANVLTAHGRYSRTEAMARAVELLHSVGIPDPVSRLPAYPHELSGGMCQRVIIALAIAHSPRLLLVDEPTSGLDVTISAQILDLLRDAVHNLHSGLIVVSRDLGVVDCRQQLAALDWEALDQPLDPQHGAAFRAAHYSRSASRAAAACSRCRL